MRAKVWEAGTPEPALWQVDIARGESADMGDSLTLSGWVGNVTGELELAIDGISGQRSAIPGQVVVHELVGAADGEATTFPTAHPYAPGSIRPLVAGIASAALSEDPAGATFSLDYTPTQGAICRVRYIAA